MNIVSRIGLAGMLAFAALSVCAAPATGVAGKSKFDVTGTWNVTSAGGPGPATNIVLVLKQDGDKLSGTVATNGAPPIEITEARVLRTTIYFEVTLTMPSMGGGPGGQRGPGGAAGGPPGMPGMGMGRSMTMKYTGSPSGNELKLTSQMKQTAREGDGPSGSMPKTELVAKRQ